MKNQRTLLILILISFTSLSCLSFAQSTQRKHPAQWNNLVKGGRFMDRFQTMPQGIQSDHCWGDKAVAHRFVNNGIEDTIHSFWGGNILKDKQGLYHMMLCGWLENSTKGHMSWPKSSVYHAICNNPIGPFVLKDSVGKGHNPEIFKLKNGGYATYYINGYYFANSLNGPWQKKQFSFDPRDRKIIEGLSNLTFTHRQDSSVLMICRGGGTWISKTGTSTYYQISDQRAYPAVEGRFEDPCVWRDHVQYNMIVNDWYGRIAYYLRSLDGVHWITDPGEAYQPGIARHPDGSKEGWFKYERIKIRQDKYGRAIQANFAVIDTIKWNDLSNDNHSSKNISIPLNPGLLLSILTPLHFSPKTKKITVRVKAEPGFDPSKNLDLKSLRLGVSGEVNFGRGGQVLSTKVENKDLIITFDAIDNRITKKTFALKLLGHKNNGDLIFGYCRLPWVNDTPALVSARAPIMTSEGMKIKLENFGLTTCGKIAVQLIRQEKDKREIISSLKIDSIPPYGNKIVTIPFDQCKNIATGTYSAQTINIE